MRPDQATNAQRSVVPFEQSSAAGSIRSGGLAVVMATYNGAKYLSQQIRSIQAQTVPDWKLYLRDDGSSDATCEIAEREAADDDRIRIICDGRGRLGTPGNFGAAARRALDEGARYVWFCDQDDLWHNRKLERQLGKMRELEAVHGRGAAVAVHSDLAVVDDDLALRSPSFAEYQKVRHVEREVLKTLLVQNFVTGCTMVINRPLAERALPLPSRIVIHDWWLALCAASTGKIGYVDEALTFYRQHNDNQIGARGWQSLLVGPGQLRARWRNSVANFAASIEQCHCLRRRSRHWGDVAGETLALVDDYLALFTPQTTPLERTRGIMRLGTWPQRLQRKVLLVARLLTYRGAGSLALDDDAGDAAQNRQAA